MRKLVIILLFLSIVSSASQDVKDLYKIYVDQRLDYQQMLIDRREDLRSGRADIFYRSQKLERTIDFYLRAYRDGKIEIKEALVSLFNPSVLKGTGYILKFLMSAESINEVVTAENQVNLSRTFRGSDVVAPAFDMNGYPQSPGRVHVVLPQINNGFELFHLKNHQVALQLLNVLAEELYHTVQTMRNGNKNKWIAGSGATLSQFFKNGYPDTYPDGTKLGNDQYVLEMRWEADVYAKLIENLGVENVPERIGKIYPQRAWVDQHRSKLVRERELKFKEKSKWISGACFRAL